MNKYEKLSLTLFVVGCVVVFLPTAFAGVTCYSCSSEPLVSPSQCNMGSTSGGSCSHPRARCFAATAELTNGTVIGYKGCFPVSATCNNDSTDCAKAINITGVSFNRCSAYCCNGANCNQNLPMLPSISTAMPAPTTEEATPTATTTTGEATPTATTTTGKAINPKSTASVSVKATAAGIKIKAFYYLPILYFCLS